MKTFTEAEVDKLVRATITETANGVLEWLKAETRIVDKTTKEELPNSEIDMMPNKRKKVQEYVYPRLVKHGIKITETDLSNLEKDITT